MFLVAQAVVKPGDEVIIADPVDFLLERSVLAAGGVIKRFDEDPLLPFLRPSRAASSKQRCYLCNPQSNRRNL